MSHTLWIAARLLIGLSDKVAKQARGACHRDESGEEKKLKLYFHGKATPKACSGGWGESARGLGKFV